MLSGIGLSLNLTNEELYWRYIIRRLMSFGIPSSGDFATDKQILQKIESGKISAITEISAPKSENYTENTDYNDSEQTNLELQRTGAEQLAMLIKLRLGLL